MKLNEELKAMWTGSKISPEIIDLIQSENDAVEEQGNAPGIAIGEKAPDFCLKDVHGRQVCLADKLQEGPVVLSFYRGKWCPFCNAEIKALAQAFSRIRDLGGSVLAIGPQAFQDGRELSERYDLQFDVLSDPEQEVINLYRLQINLMPNMRDVYINELNVNLEKENANGAAQLPIPATFILDKKGTVIARYVNPHFYFRMEPESIINSLHQLSDKNNATLAELRSENEILRNRNVELNAMQAKLIIQENRAMVGDLATGLFHELKNLLNPVAALDFIKEELSEEGKNWVKLVYDARDRSVALMDEVRTLARNEVATISKKEVNLKDIITESIFLSRMDSEIAGIDIQDDCACEHSVYANRNKIIQVLLNLIRNGSHATQKKGAGRIRIDSEICDGFVFIRVSDNGVGIDATKIEKIWEPFYTTKGDKGTGIGLEICRKIIGQHGGEMSVTSKVDEGSVFSFSLPLFL